MYSTISYSYNIVNDSNKNNLCLVYLQIAQLPASIWVYLQLLSCLEHLLLANQFSFLH